MLKNYRTKYLLNKNLSLFFMIFITLITQVVILMRTSIVAEKFGIGIEMDAFNFSNNIAIFIFSFIGTGVTTVLIPAFINKESKVAINTFISILYTIAFVILLLTYWFKDFIIPFVSVNDNTFNILANSLMLTVLLTHFLSSILATTNAIFQCENKYNIPKVITLLTSLLLVSILYLYKDLSMLEYAHLILMITLINVIIQVFLTMRNSFEFRYSFEFKNKQFINMLKIFLPTILSTGVYQISLFTDTIISAKIGEGSISILTYSNTIMAMLNTVLLVNITNYFYPKITKNINEKNSQIYLFNLILSVNALMCLIVSGFFVVGEKGISLLYQRGEFTSDITRIVYLCTIVYMIGFPINSIRDLIYRYFYAKGDTVTPFKNSLIISMLNIFISIILSYFWGLIGIIIGTVITSFISLYIILVKFNNKFNFPNNKKDIIIENLKIVFITLLNISIMKFFITLIPISNLLLFIVINGCGTVLVYIILLFLFKSKVITQNIS